MKIVALAFFIACVSANVFLQSPRGSNNRHSDDNDNRQNAQRLFDSNNDARGGYNAGEPMYYYIGSKLDIEWTMQHGCGTHDEADGYAAEEKVNCEVILQYMCSEWARDGTTDDSITSNNAMEMSGDVYTYGMHENWDYYNMCQMRPRNRGLWVADYTFNDNTQDDARFTRQNPQGTRFGFECPEERDYYPYWHPTPWRDIAIYTNNPDRCTYYQTESQNQNPKSWCTSPQFNNELDCPQGEWQSGMAHDIEAPFCDSAPFSRANHLGNTIGGYPHHHTWTVPRVNDADSNACVLRIRYNISTAEVDWNLDWQSNEEDVSSNTFYKAYGVNSPVIRNPYIPFFTSPTFNISYAIRTDAYGRTFEDRSHTFMIRERPESTCEKPIYNLNVKGKRGNIVETFPATEYDFHPDYLEVNQYDFVHIQWTGTDQNPANAAGEGLDQTDRHNFVQCDSSAHHVPSAFPPENMLFSTEQEAIRFAFGGMNYYGSLCKSLGVLLSSNANDNEVEEDVYNCMKMNLGSPYFDGGLLEMIYPGTFHYMSTRNNNFTNRTQKGVIIVHPMLESERCNGDPDPTVDAHATLPAVMMLLLATLF